MINLVLSVAMVVVCAGGYIKCPKLIALQDFCVCSTIGGYSGVRQAIMLHPLCFVVEGGSAYDVGTGILCDASQVAVCWDSVFQSCCIWEFILPSIQVIAYISYSMHMHPDVVWWLQLE